MDRPPEAPFRQKESADDLAPPLKIRDLRVRPVNVPMNLPLQTSGGTVGMALAGIDMAAWDALAKTAGGSDLAMQDAMKIGGVTGWLRAASFAESAGLPVSSHLFPEVSAHLLAVTPTCHWLEYVDWASPVLEEPVRYREKLSEGGEPDAQQCGWLKGRFGVSRQVTPRILLDMLAGPDPARSRRSMEEMLKMKKFDIAALERVQGS